MNFSSSPKERPYWLRAKAHLHPMKDDGHAILWAFTTSPNHFAMLNVDDGRCIVLILNSEFGDWSGELEHALNGIGRIVAAIAHTSGESGTVDHYRIVEARSSFDVTLSTLSKSDEAPADLRAVLSLTPDGK